MGGCKGRVCEGRGGCKGRVWVRVCRRGVRRMVGSRARVH